MSKTTPAALGAALIALALSGVAWLASRTPPPSADAVAGLEESAARPWTIDAGVRDTMLAQLPAVFEPRALAARRHGLRVPALSAFTFEFAPARAGKRPLIYFWGRCDPSASADPPLVPDPASTAPGAEPAREACLLSGLYDPEQHRYVQASMDLFPYQPAYRSSRFDCGDRRFDAVTRLPALPPDIEASLGDPADRGEPFQATDVIRPGGGKSRRFLLAAIGPDVAFVAVEHGGIAYNVEIWLFERRDGHWDGEVRWLGGLPNSLQALLHDACAGVPYPPLRDLDKGELTYVFTEENGDVRLVTVDEPRMDYTLHPRFGRADDILGSDPGHHPLSPRERRDLRARLLERRAEILPDWPAYGELTRFLNALATDSR